MIWHQPTVSIFWNLCKLNLRVAWWANTLIVHIASFHQRYIEPNQVMSWTLHQEGASTKRFKFEGSWTYMVSGRVSQSRDIGGLRSVMWSGPPNLEGSCWNHQPVPDWGFQPSRASAWHFWKMKVKVENLTILKSFSNTSPFDEFDELRHSVKFLFPNL